MALIEPVTMREPSTPVAPAPRRSLLGRWSTGHVAMVLAGLFAFLLNLAFLQSGTDPVLVATARIDLQPGTVLGPDDVAGVPVEDAGELTATLVTMDAARALYGSLIGRQVKAGEPLRLSDVRPAGTVAGLREYSVEVENADAAGGLIRASDLVDVIATVDERTFYVATGLDVVQVTREGSGLEVGDRLIIVLAVDDRTALELASAQAAGHIALLRSTGAPPPVSGPVLLDPSS